jgi:transposase
MTGFAPIPHGSGAFRGKRAIAGGRRHLRHVLFQAALVAAHHNPSLKTVAGRPKSHGKPHNLILSAVARRLITIANAILKSGLPWQPQRPV